jgi:soluble lytic murein transglycosylase-like protein
MGKFSDIKITLPDIKKQFVSGSIDYSNKAVKQSNVKTIQSINANYGSLIKYWSNVFEIPYGIIIGFIATESGGKMVKPNKYMATGLMQVTPSAIYECVTKWSNEVDSPLPMEAINEINKKVPELLRKAPLTSTLKAKILSLLEKDAAFNIMAGTLVIRWLLERFASPIYGGQINKAMVSYNAGAYTKALVSGGKAITTPIDSTLLATNLKVPVESRSYLYKMLGVDGFLSLIYQQEAISK